MDYSTFYYPIAVIRHAVRLPELLSQGTPGSEVADISFNVGLRVAAHYAESSRALV